MSSKLGETIYNHSPVWMQNLLLSGYGLKLYKARYSSHYRQHLRFLKEAQRYTASELRHLQAQELHRLLSHAQNNVPWYRRLFAALDVQASDINPDNLGQLLPILEKDQVQANAALLTADGLKASELHTLNTSGTTGSPLAIKATKEAIQKNYAFFERFLNTAGIASRDRSVTFAGRMLLPPRQEGPPYWRHNLIMNNLLCSSYHISPSTAGDYLRRIAAFDPAFIDTYPSAAYTLAQHLLDQGSSSPVCIRPKAVITSSETLLDHQRTAIEQAFGCPVFDQYGSAEMAACITQCEHGRYHVNPEYGIVEVIREDGLPAAPGESGDLICTGFLNDAMPMIRYRIGDSALVSSHNCECGRLWPALDSILGRVDDLIVTTSGRRIGRLDPLFKGLSGIQEAQIVQLTREHVVVNLVPTHDYSEETGNTLLDALQRRVGCDMKIELRFLDRIPRSASGKFRAVVSKVSAASGNPASDP